MTEGTEKSTGTEPTDALTHAVISTRSESRTASNASF